MQRALLRQDWVDLVRCWSTEGVLAVPAAAVRILIKPKECGHNTAWMEPEPVRDIERRCHATGGYLRRDDPGAFGGLAAGEYFALRITYNGATLETSMIFQRGPRNITTDWAE